MNKNIPDSFMTLDGMRYRVYWSDKTGQFESEPVIEPIAIGIPQKPIRVFSSGGGVQSTAALVLAAQGKIDFKIFLFCNVGDDSENPETLAYVHDVAMPYAQANGIELIELQRTWQKGERKGQKVTLYSEIMRADNRSMKIPVHFSGGGMGNRSCTIDYKVDVVDRWLREHDAKEQGAHVGIGISLDEWHRMRSGGDPDKPWKTLVYPLIDLKLDRAACVNIITTAGLPVPPKSSCFFCPFHAMAAWQNLRLNQPDAFQKAVKMDEVLRERSMRLGKGEVWLASRHRPLELATSDYVQGDLFGDEQSMCESGYCWT